MVVVGFPSETNITCGVVEFINVLLLVFAVSNDRLYAVPMP